MGGFRSVVCTMCVEIADFCKWVSSVSAIVKPVLSVIASLAFSAV
jgi:hypothetical protein